jgi:CRISPR-associated protein Cas1
MAWRTVVISNPAKLKIDHSQLSIIQEQTVNLPVEDISALILESPEITLSASLLYRLAQAGTILVVCDDKHMPCMAGLPYDPHSRLAGAQRLQLSQTLPYRKRCWQLIIKQKIENQAECLKLMHRLSNLRGLVDKVASGDSGNIEAWAAKVFFSELYGDDFSRSDDNALNSALNYGYAIFRGAVARALSSHGFLLSHGVHHRSELNAFNLADDFIEPFRPIVDLWTASNITRNTVFSKEHRQGLVWLLACEVMIDGKRHGINHALEIMASSFVTACREKQPSALKLPALLPLVEHCYE